MVEFLFIDVAAQEGCDLSGLVSENYKPFKSLLTFLLVVPGQCAEDKSHAALAAWKCADGCSTCTCIEGKVQASGCLKAPDSAAQPAEAYFVTIAFVTVVICFVAFVVIMYIILCCRRKGQPLPSKELKSPEEEEEDQLAAGD